MTTDPKVAAHQLELISRLCDEEGIPKTSQSGDLLSVYARVQRMQLRLNSEIGQALNEIEGLVTKLRTNRVKAT